MLRSRRPGPRAGRRSRWLLRVTFGALALAACAEPLGAPQSMQRGGRASRDIPPPEEGELPTFDMGHTVTYLIMTGSPHFPTEGAEVAFGTAATGFVLYTSATSSVQERIDWKYDFSFTYACTGFSECSGHGPFYTAKLCPSALVEASARTEHFALGFGWRNTTTTATDKCGYTPPWPDPPAEGGPGTTVVEPTDGSGGPDDACTSSGGELYDAWWDYDYDGIGDEYIGRVCVYGMNMS